MVDKQVDIKRQLLATFQAELEENRSILNRGILSLEKGLSREEQTAVLAELFRAAHSIKGASRAVELLDIEKIAHRMEDVLGAIQHGASSPGPEIFDALFSAADSLKAAMDVHIKGDSLSAEKQDKIISDLSAALAITAKAGGGDEPKEERRNERRGQPPPKPETAEPAPAFTGERPLSTKPSAAKAIPTEETIRVATAKLDLLMDGMGELMVARMRTDQRLRELRDIQSMLVPWQKSWRRVRPGYTRARQQSEKGAPIIPFLDFLGCNEKGLKSLGEAMNRLVQGFAGDHNRLSLLTDNLQNGVRRVRMLPIATLFDPFPRMVRDMARQQGKAVDLELEGIETEVDRKVLEIMKAPLTHLLRNAVDHGIEAPDRREKAGKARGGTIYLHAARKGNAIVLKVADDGGGIDLAALKQHAVKRGMVTEEIANSLKEKEITDLIFRSGLSTVAKATEISGRGVGLDVVRENLERLHGRISIKTVTGQGTVFRLSLPLTLVTSQVLLLGVAGETVAVPTTTVTRILLVDPAQVGNLDGRPAVIVDGQPLALLSLARVLALGHTDAFPSAGKKIPVIVLGANGKRLAFIVDRLHDTQEVVVKNMGRVLRRVRNVAGATVLGNGRVVMILNVSDLIKSAHGEKWRPEPLHMIGKPADRQRILLVDDSITTRTLEKNILANAGYEVFVAADGEEAWSLLQSQALEAIVTDIDMPGMNGFDLTEKVKNHDRFKELPVILVTSLESPRDKIRGMEAGADAYITKGAFDQSELLETVERLIG